MKAGYAAMATGFVSDSGVPQIDDLFSRGGMASMLTTIWLVLGALSFAAVMEHAGFLQRLLEPIVSRARRRGSLIAAVNGSGIGLNVIAGDQYVADVLPARMFRKEFARRGLAPQVLSRRSRTPARSRPSWCRGTPAAPTSPACSASRRPPTSRSASSTCSARCSTSSTATSASRCPEAETPWEDDADDRHAAGRHPEERPMTDPTTTAPAEPRRGFKLPSAYTILFALIVLMAIATWIIPAGAYELDKDGSPIPGTYHSVDSHPARILVDSLTAPINGLYGIEDAKGNINYYNSGTLFGAIDVALFIIVIGGFLGVTMRTGAIQAGIGRLVARLRGRERWMIPILMTVFALGGTTYGMAEESLAFYALVIAVMIAAGYDALTGAAVVLLGCGIGTFGSTINPFATGIASGFAGVSISDGLLLRLVMLVVGLALGHLLRAPVRRPGQGGPVPVGGRQHARGERARTSASTPARRTIVMTGRQKAILVVFGAGLRRDDVRRHPVGGPQHRPPHAVVVVPGDDRVVHPVQHHHRPHRPDVARSDLTDSFVDGARDLLGVALIIGIARGITVVMNNGEITDTVLHWAEQALGDVGQAGFAIVMFLLFLPLSFLIPSSSGPGHRRDADHEPRWRRSPTSRPTWSSRRSRAPRGS